MASSLFAPRTPADFGGASRSTEEDDMFFEVTLVQHLGPASEQALHGPNAPTRRVTDRVDFTGAQTPEPMRRWGQPLH